MPRWDPETALGLIERESVTYMVGPPTLFVTLMDCDALRSGPHGLAADDLLRRGRGDARVLRAGRGHASGGGEALLRLHRGSHHRHLTIRRPPVAKMVLTDGRAFGDTRMRVDGRRRALGVGAGTGRPVPRSGRHPGRLRGRVVPHRRPGHHRRRLGHHHRQAGRPDHSQRREHLRNRGRAAPGGPPGRACRPRPWPNQTSGWASGWLPSWSRPAGSTWAPAGNGSPGGRRPTTSHPSGSKWWRSFRCWLLAKWTG